MGRGLLGLRMAVVRMRSCQGSAGCGCRYRSHDSTSYEVGGPKPPAAEARSFSKHACPAGFSPSIVSHAVRQPVAAAWQRAAPRRRLDAPPLGCGLVRGSDGTAIGGPFTVASGRADSTSQTSAARSRPLAEGCFSHSSSQAPPLGCGLVRGGAMAPLSAGFPPPFWPEQRIARVCGGPQLRPAKARNSCECVRFASCAPGTEASGEGKIPHRTAPKALPLPSSANAPPAA